MQRRRWQQAVCPVPSPSALQEGGWLAAQMAEQLPWVKVVISMRDPISQALAMFLHNYMHNRT